MDGFNFVRAQEVEFRDIDGMGHVNNAVYLNYLESAKIGYFRHVLGLTELEQMGIVGDVRIKFRSPAFLGETLSIGARVSRVGTKSMEFEFEIRGGDGRLVAEAVSAHVAFDYGPRATVEISPDWRRKIEEFEATSLATV
ncbi:MAG: acyl-CoA thioesterase [Actinobacteria bacterium]|nr:acyl-CoA thioesterase [Actinomycetota bacterium]